jgi:undecaprenyl diphosphate synthase
MFRRFFEAARRRCPARGIRVEAIGRRHRLPADLRESIDAAERATSAGEGMLLRVAVDYSSRASIRAGHPPGPDVDLLIRTGGEYRLSDFLLEELAQAELLFLPDLWPDFGPAELRNALANYHRRERRLGAVGRAS